MDSQDREAIEGLFTKLGDVERQAGPRDAEAERFIADRLGSQPGAPYYMAQTIVMQDLALRNQQMRIEALERAAKGQPQASEGGGFFSGAAAGAGSASRTSVPGVGVPGVGTTDVGAARASGPWGGGGSAPQPGAHSPTSAPEPLRQQAFGEAPQQSGTGGAPQQGFGGLGGRGGGGGFLAGAAQTAVGVAGGVMLGSALGSMLGGHGGGLFGGGTPEVQETVTNTTINEAPPEPAREVSDTGTDDPQPDAGYQDAAYDDAGSDASAGDGFDDGGGFEDF